MVLEVDAVSAYIRFVHTGRAEWTLLRYLRRAIATFAGPVVVEPAYTESPWDLG